MRTTSNIVTCERFAEEGTFLTKHWCMAMMVICEKCWGKHFLNQADVPGKQVKSFHALSCG